tara:strand:- start:1739 stop:2491 length:753 start_codon:yes stop_codon:yes gene_type:complete
MTKDNTTNDAGSILNPATNNEEANSNDAAAPQENSSTSVADTFYPDAKEGDKTAADDSVDNTNQGESDDPSKTADEGDKDDESSDESKEGDDKKINYDDVVLPSDLPEGIEVDQGLLDGVKEIAGKHSIPKEAVQELVDAYSKRFTDADNTLKDQWSEIEQGWIKSAKTDKEIGGERFETSVKKANVALDRFGTPELREALDQTRLGNHPEMIRLMSKIGEAISEGGSFDKGGNAPQIPAVDVMYDNKSS